MKEIYQLVIKKNSEWKDSPFMTDYNTDQEYEHPVPKDGADYLWHCLHNGTSEEYRDALNHLLDQMMKAGEGAVK